MPDNKVALFIDFDNIRIGIRQHFGGDLHPQKLMGKASKYGRVVTAKAYADFTGHPREFQDKLLFAAGIEPIHAPSKISGGRRQSSADMHMVIDMFLEAIDNPDVDTFILMTGDADFVRMVATLRRRFGRKVIVSGVQSTSTSLDLMNAADARDPITRQDVDMTGELGRMTRPLVTRADLDAQAAVAAEEAAQPKKGGIFGGLFKRKAAAPSPAATPIPAPRVAPAPPAPRRMRASELRGGRTAPATPGISRERTTGSASAGTRGAPSTATRTATGRGRQAAELPPVAPGSEPDDFEKKLIQEIFTMPPGRSGFNTIKTIEETLRSKAGKLGGTRKEIPARLDRLEAMGLFKREMRSRGAGQVPAGDLVLDHPVVVGLTASLSRPEAKEQPIRSPRTPRPPRDVTPEATTGEAPQGTTGSEARGPYGREAEREAPAALAPAAVAEAAAPAEAEEAKAPPPQRRSPNPRQRPKQQRRRLPRPRPPNRRPRQASPRPPSAGSPAPHPHRSHPARTAAALTRRPSQGHAAPPAVPRRRAGRLRSRPLAPATPRKNQPPRRREGLTRLLELDRCPYAGRTVRAPHRAVSWSRPSPRSPRSPPLRRRCR